MHARLTHYAVLMLGQAAIGAAALLARAGLAAGLAPLALSAWRLSLATAVMAAGAALARTPAPRLAAADRLRLGLAGLCLAGHFTAWFASLARIPVARSTLLVTTSPLWAGLAERFLLGRTLPARFWIGLLVATAGCALVTTGETSAPRALTGDPVVGDLLATAGAVLIAAYMLLVADLQARLGTRRVVLWTCGTAAAALVIASCAAGVLAWPATAGAWGSILGMALIPQLIGHTALNWSLKHFPAGVVGAATLLEPVFAAALAFVLLDERPGAQQIAGAAVLLFGVFAAVTTAPSPAGLSADQMDQPGGNADSNRGT